MASWRASLADPTVTATATVGFTPIPSRRPRSLGICSPWGYYAGVTISGVHMAGKDESTVLALGVFLVGMLGMVGLMVLGIKELWALGLVWLGSMVLVYSLQQATVLTLEWLILAFAGTSVVVVLQAVTVWPLALVALASAGLVYLMHHPPISPSTSGRIKSWLSIAGLPFTAVLAVWLVGYFLLSYALAFGVVLAIGAVALVVEAVIQFLHATFRRKGA